MEEKKEDFPLWDGVFCPSYFKSELKFYPDPNQIVYIVSSDNKIMFGMGFSENEDLDWNNPIKLSDLLLAATKANYKIGDAWGFAN